MSTALYRRYRPQTFAEVIGQDHVTAPLRQALRSGQVNHAYLFSGPRGCGKTSSARILARVLNCATNTAEQPTDMPCGVCASCVELATGGPGSLDVVEIDAASHGGVDDARELRERATFAPARDRFKVFVLDEAHMVTPQGFNALLKIVEEPPPHVKFVFATTEPDKVIGTVRSRTHHYPFRLVAPDVLVPYLEQVCDREGVRVGPGVLSLVVRAGAGSVRDSLSVLDQLVAGAGPDGLTYDPAVALLGYTPASLLDDLVEALAARDGAAVFRVVERVVDAGHEPRRFVEDLTERLRDLIVVAACGDQSTAVLRDVPTDQLDRMRAQATHLGPAELSRSADLAATGLTEMTGATSPRLQLELLTARLLLPAADDSARGLGARLDRVERSLAGGFVPAGPAGGSAGAGAPASAQAADAPDRSRTAAGPAADSPDAGAGRATPPAAPDAARPPAPHPEVGPARPPSPEPSARPVARQPQDAPSGPQPAASTPAPGTTRQAMDTEMLRRRWSEVLATVAVLRKLTSALVADNALPLALDATTLRLGFTRPGHVNAFRSSGHAEIVARALHETLGVDVRVEAELHDPAAATVPVSPSPVASPAMPTPAQAEASWSAPARPGPTPPTPAPDQASAPASSAPPAEPPDAGPPCDDAPPAEPPDDDPPWDDAPPAPPRGTRSPAPPAPDEPSPDDPDLAGSGLVGAPLIAQMLGGQVIAEELVEPE
ncbi:MAG: DNA polymerase III subunit gamma and tau [Micrococcales bacterium]|nr:DNA polymerase III subunit gamma and tau [Micrococcales bacterium]